MANPSDDWITFYGLEDIPKRAWISPMTFQATKQLEAAKLETKAVVEVVKDRVWLNVFVIGVIVGLGTIGGLIWKATLP